MELNAGDIVNLMTIIDLSTQRGVFKASDLVAVGQLYEKLKTISEKLAVETEKNKVAE